MKHLFPLTVLLMAFGFTPVAQASSDQPLPTSHDYKLREQMRAVQIEQAMLHRERSHGGVAARKNENAQQEAVANQNPLQVELPSSASEEVRRANRLSPEERRALRRQIDDAAHQIYTPR